MNTLKNIKVLAMIMFVVVLLGSFLLAALSYHLLVITTPGATTATNATPVATVPSVVSTTTGTANYPPPVPPASILGIVADAHPLLDIPWIRLGYFSCGTNNVQGSVLKKTVESYHL